MLAFEIRDAVLADAALDDAALDDAALDDAALDELLKNLIGEGRRPQLQK
jgi:hypothetical protein